MIKILLFLFIATFFIFPKPPALAQEACTPGCVPPLIEYGGNCARDLTGSGATAKTGTCLTGKTPTNPSDITNCTCQPTPAGAGIPGIPTSATTAPPASVDCRDAKNKSKCTGSQGQRCSTTNGGYVENGDGISTAIGCIPTQPQKLVEGILRYGTLASGGIAFLLMIFAALQMITAEGNPDTIKKSQEKFYSAIIGLLLVIFSVLLMQIIGVDLLGLKGFTR